MMDSKKQPIKSCLHRSETTREFTHLRPLSVYSRMIACKTDVQAGDLSWSPCSLFRNIKVEVVNNNASVRRKRQLDDSCLDETYESPLKKPCLTKCHSPDLACVLDSSDTLPESKPSTPKLSSVVSDKSNKTGWRSTNKETELHPLREHAHLVDSGLGNCQSRLYHGHVQTDSLPGVAGEVEVNFGPAFDSDVDIMCLSPIGRDEEPAISDGLGDLIQSCQTFCEGEKVQEVLGGGGGYGSCCRAQSAEEHSRKDVPVGTNIERDEGYYTKSYKMAASKGAKYKSSSTTKTTKAQLRPTLTPVMSTPLAKCRKLVGQSPIMNTELRLETEEPPSTDEPNSEVSLCGSFKLGACNTDSFPTIPFLENTSTEGKIWSVGTSTLKSLECCGVQLGTVATGASSQVRENADLLVSEQQAEPKFQVTFWEKSGSADMVKSTLPLRAQKLEVDTKSAAVARPSRPQSPPLQPKRKARPASQSQDQRDAQRPTGFHAEQDWEREKKLYVDSVTRHVADNATAGDGVMTELLHLMNTVASKGKGRAGSQWQHPSDLTCRNYQQRNTGRLLSLTQWQNLNHRKHQRFATVPAVFQRSAVI